MRPGPGPGRIFFSSSRSVLRFHDVENRKPETSTIQKRVRYTDREQRPQTSLEPPAVHIQYYPAGSDPVNQFAAASKRVFPPVLAIVN